MKPLAIKFLAFLVLWSMMPAIINATITPTTFAIDATARDGFILGSPYNKYTTEVLEFGFHQTYLLASRGWLKISTASIDNSATITAITLYVKAESSKSANLAYFYDVSNDPETATGATLFNDLGAGNTYGSWNQAVTAGTWYSFSLNAQACTDLQTSLTSTDWWAMSLKMNSEGSPTYRIYDYTSGASNAAYFRITYTLSGWSSYVFYAIYKEDGTGPTAETLTIALDTGESGTQAINGLLYVGTSDPIASVSWDCGTSQYRMMCIPSVSPTSVYFYEPESGTTIEPYLFYFRDLSGWIPAGDCYLETYRVISGASKLIERKLVSDSINGIPVYFARTKIYQIKFLDSLGESHDFGYFLPIGAANQETTLILQELQFDQQIQLAYAHLSIIGTRSADKTEIEVTYADDLDGYDITEANITIKDRAGSTVYSDSTSGETDTWTKSSLTNTTDYVVYLTFEHEFYGSLKWTRAYEGFDNYADPIDFTDTGLTFGGIDGAEIAGLTILIFVAGIFTTLNAPVGIFATVLTAGLLSRIGWITTTDTLLGVAVALAVIFALTRGGRN